MKPIMIACLLALCCGACAVGPKRGPSVAAGPLLLLDFSVRVGPDGVPVDIVPASDMPAPLQAAVRKRVATWRYRPGRWKGAAVSGTVYQRIVAEADPTAPAGTALRIREMAAPTRRLDPGVAKDAGGMPPPDYPVDLLRRGVGGVLVYAVRAGADGQARDVERVDPVALDADHARLDAAARDAIARWTLTPVEVDGVPIDCRMLVPIGFWIQGQSAAGGFDANAYRQAHDDVCPAAPVLQTDVVGTLL